MNTDTYTERKIYETTNYDQFIILEENRPVTSNTVGNSILQKNLLKDNEILVTQNLEVLDGQHRLEFARKQKIPIYYKIAEVTEKSDIALLQIQQCWRLVDHKHFYKDNPNYKFVDDIIKKYGFSVQSVIESCDSSKKASTMFRSGTFEIKHDKELLETKFRQVYELIESAKFIASTISIKRPYVSCRFFRTLWTYVGRPKYDHDRLMNAFNKYPEAVMNALSLNSQALITQAIDNRLYNYHRRKEND